MKYRGLLLPMILAAMCGDDAFVLNTKRGKGMQSTYRREKIVRTEKEFDITRSQDRANIMFNYHLTHKWDQYYH